MRLHRITTLRSHVVLASKVSSFTLKRVPISSIRCASSISLHPFRKKFPSPDRRWREIRRQSGAAAALYVYTLNGIRTNLTWIYRKEQPTEFENTAQAKAGINSPPAREAARLARVRNIGIAVSKVVVYMSFVVDLARPILTAVRLRQRSAFCITRDESIRFTKSVAKMPWERKWTPWI